MFVKLAREAERRLYKIAHLGWVTIKLADFLNQVISQFEFRLNFAFNHGAVAVPGLLRLALTGLAGRD